MLAGYVRSLSSTHCKSRNVYELSSWSIVVHFIQISNDLCIGKMRRRISAFANVSDKSEVARSLDDLMRDFLKISSSTQRSQLVAMDAIRLIKLCRTSLQPSRIAVIWPLILKIGILPAENCRISATLVGSVVSSVLEAKDTTTAASVWEFVRSSPWFSVDDVIVIQLLGALRDRPDLIIELVTELLQGSLGVRAQIKHLNAALQALSNAPKDAKRVFELASECNMVLLFFRSCDPLTFASWTF